MKRVYHIAIMAVAALSLVACARDQMADKTSPQPEKAVIVNTADGAFAGELMVKFHPKVTELLDRACATRTDAGVMTRSGIPDVDQVLDVIGTYRIERIFPTNDCESKTRLSGLHLWYLVKFDEGSDIQQAAGELAQLGDISKIQYSQELKRQQIERPTPLNAETAQSLKTMRSATAFNDPNLPAQWHYINTGDTEFLPGSKAGADVNCAEAWQKCTGDPSIIVAVIDEGVMWSHPDLKDNMWVNEKEIYKSTRDNDANGYAGDVYGYNFTEDTGVIVWDTNDDTGHGTHVAGTIAAMNNNGIGVCGVAGGSGNADGVKIMSIQIFSGAYGAMPYNEARGIKYAADNGAVILQCSWGYNSSMSDPAGMGRGFATDEQWAKNCPLEKEAFDYFVHNAGSPNGVIDGGIVVFAAGNEYAPAAGYPGAFGDFICVASMDAGYMPASYTNYAKGVNITAPGGDADFHQTQHGSILSTLPPGVSNNTYYGYMDGTSMACPHVSGVAALGLSYAAKLRKHFTAKQYKELVLASFRDLSPHMTENKLYYKYFSQAGTANPVLMELRKYYQGNMGNGLIDAGKLLSKIEGENIGAKLDIPNVYLTAGESQSFELSRFFDDGGTMTFIAQTEDAATATVSTTARTITVTGVKTGSTTYSVTASNGRTQTAYITVRRSANDNGWL